MEKRRILKGVIAGVAGDNLIRICFYFAAEFIFGRLKISALDFFTYTAGDMACSFAGGYIAAGIAKDKKAGAAVGIIDVIMGILIRNLSVWDYFKGKNFWWLIVYTLLIVMAYLGGKIRMSQKSIIKDYLKESLREEEHKAELNEKQYNREEDSYRWIKGLAAGYLFSFFANIILSFIFRNFWYNERVGENYIDFIQKGIYFVVSIACALSGAAIWKRKSKERRG